MKRTIIIETDNRMSFDKILDSFRMTKGVKKVEASFDECIPGIPVTHEEIIEDIRCAEEEIARGVPGIPHEEVVEQMKRKFASWR